MILEVIDWYLIFWIWGKRFWGSRSVKRKLICSIEENVSEVRFCFVLWSVFLDDTTSGSKSIWLLYYRLYKGCLQCWTTLHRITTSTFIPLNLSLLLSDWMFLVRSYSSYHWHEQGCQRIVSLIYANFLQFMLISFNL